MKCVKRSLLGWVVLIVLVACWTRADAQVITGTLSGVTRDDTGGVLPGVTVTLRNLDTGITRTVVTNAQGRYSATNLSLGNYEVVAELAGFRTTVRRGITLTIGREAVVDLVLGVGDLAEEVQVTAEAPLIDTTGSTIGALVNERMMRDLPLNGRSFTQLAALQPGVVSPPTTTVREGVNQGFGKKLIVNGARPTQNVFLLDGADMSDGAGSVPGSAGGNVLGVESVREFTVLTSNLSAEYGRAAGAVFSSVTKSGTNELHGSAFGFHRNDALDARNFFATDKPNFTRYQYGVSLGGPIAKDRTFFFGNYEGLRERLGVVELSGVPNALAREGLVPVGGRLTQVTVAPAVKPILALYPLPNGRDFGDGTGEFRGTYTQPTDEDFFVVKADHQLSQKGHSFFGRYTYNNGAVHSPQTIGLFNETVETDKQFGTFELTDILSPAMLNVFRFNVNRSISNQYNDAVGDNVTLPSQLTFLEGRVPGNIDAPGVEGIGYDTSLPRFVNQKLYELADTVQYTKGMHALRMGVSWKLFHVDLDNKQNAGGTFAFSSMSEFLTGQPRNLEIMLPGSDTVRRFRQNLIGMFIQDDLRVRSNLTVNMGLRYEFITTPTEADGKESNLRDPLHDTEFTVGEPLFENPSFTNFAPRVGFSWDPTNAGKTAVRGGFGMFHEQLLPHWYSTSFTRGVPFYQRATIQDRAVLASIFPRIPPAVLAETPPGYLDLATWTPKNPYMLQFNVNVQRELQQGTVVTVGYVGTRGFNLFRAFDVNSPIPDRLPDGRWYNPVNAQGQPIRQRRNPVWGPTVFKDTASQSFYNGIIVGVQRRFSQGLQLQASYTGAKSIDDSSNNRFSTELGGDIGVMQIADDPKADRGLSAWDLRHNLVVNFTYDLPFGAGSTGAARGLLGGWQLNAIANLASGTPVTAVLGIDQAKNRPRTSTAEGQRPNLAPGKSNNPVLGGPDRYFDPLAFELQEVGFFGNLGRNTIIGPGMANLDFSLVKNTRFGNNRSVQVRLEMFNALNRANFALPRRVLFTRTGRRGDAGRITQTATAARQIQLGLKFLF